MPSTEPENLTRTVDNAIHVVAAVIHHNKDSDLILISKRPQHVHQGGLWEFPGGKVDASETPHQALQRELKEELDIEITHAQPLMQLHHDYTDKHIFLDVWTVLAFEGQGVGMEGQECRWVSLQDLLSPTTQYQFPQANRPVLAKLQSMMGKKS